VGKKVDSSLAACGLYRGGAKGQIMTEAEKPERDIKTLIEAIELNKMNLKERTSEEIRGIIKNTAWCISELEKLREAAKRRRENSN
jgi:hypothetical protein